MASAYERPPRLASCQSRRMASVRAYSWPMSRPFSERVAHDDWHRDVEDWVRTSLAGSGYAVAGPIEQLRIRPWSTQLAVQTDQGRVWFKANCASLAFEPLLQAELARLLPDAVDAPLAIDADRGWMLTLDRGATLADATDVDTASWRQVMTRAAHLQQATAGHREALLAAGLPDCGPETVVPRFERLIEILAELPYAHPSHVPPHLRDRLVGQRSAIADAAAHLAASSLPVTWQHGDLHPNNVFARDGRLFDFADGQWAHAVEVLSVPYGWITSQTTLAWPDVLEAYCETWGVPMVEVQSLSAAATLTQPVNRTLLWWTCLQEATAAEWAEWGSAPLHHLTRVLDP